MKRFWAVVYIFVAGSGNAFAGFHTMKPGSWLITATTTVPGMPYPIPSASRTVCYSPAEVRSHDALPAARRGCDMKSYRIRGDRMNWSMVCMQKEVITGQMTSTGTAYHAKMTTEEGGRKFATSVTGRWLGACR